MGHPLPELAGAGPDPARVGPAHGRGHSGHPRLPPLEGPPPRAQGGRLSRSWRPPGGRPHRPPCPPAQSQPYRGLPRHGRVGPTLQLLRVPCLARPYRRARPGESSRPPRLGRRGARPRRNHPRQPGASRCQARRSHKHRIPRNRRGPRHRRAPVLTRPPPPRRRPQARPEKSPPPPQSRHPRTRFQ